MTLGLLRSYHCLAQQMLQTRMDTTLLCDDRHERRLHMCDQKAQALDNFES